MKSTYPWPTYRGQPSTVGPQVDTTFKKPGMRKHSKKAMARDNTVSNFCTPIPTQADSDKRLGMRKARI